MADTLYVTITLRKEVETQEQARAIYDMIKEKLQDRPDVKIAGGVSNQFTDTE